MKISKKVFEPFSSSSRARLEALKKLRQEGLYTYVFVGQIFPYLTDLEEIFREVSPFVNHLSFEDLNLNPCRKEVFEAIKKNFPELEDKYKNLSKEFWFEKEIKKLGEKYALLRGYRPRLTGGYLKSERSEDLAERSEARYPPDVIPTIS
ncbi:MAG TPA: hypothetical protein HA298_06685 [Methanobacteriales archaeon]|nr:MAG: Radical SAM domain protein [Methanobacteriaceae archaeon 41_258]MBC7089899.1 hypothetical protein [Methanobacteriaceae archaeon]MBC7096431.1 hypothetical protein [Methanobacteriales archaeon]HIH62343.1 hypothetical protein [Methanobacteriales archaeon]